MVRMRRALVWLPAIPLVAAVIASALFFAQNGFGGGHGRFDSALGVLLLPGILLMDALPLSGAVPDFVLVVLLPAAFNVAVCAVVALIARRLLRGRSTI